jgi:parallel beta-helix repeat protein
MSPYGAYSEGPNYGFQPGGFQPGGFQPGGFDGAGFGAGYAQNAGYGYDSAHAPVSAMPIDPSCPTGNCNPCSRDLGNLMPYAWSHTIGANEYGLSGNWYTNLGVWLPLIRMPDDLGLLFFQGNGTIVEDDVYGATGGLVLRQQELALDVFTSLSLWYDIEVSPQRTMQQLGATVEWLGVNHEVRLSGYLPFGDTYYFHQATPRYSGLNIAVGTDDVALGGVELEGGIKVFRTPPLWLFAAYYQYTDFENVFAKDPLEGYRGRMEWRPSRHMSLHASVSHDDVFKTQVYAGATLSFRRLGDLLTNWQECEGDARFEQLVQRRNRITTIQQDHLARNAVTGRPIVVAQANAAAPAGGDGTAGSPFNSISDAAAAAGEHGIIFVRGGSFTGSTELQNNQRLLADGFADTTPHQVVTQNGTILLPDQLNRAAVPIPTITSSDALGTLKLCADGQFVDNVEIAGLQISNTVGSGIFGMLNNGVSIHDNTITGSVGYGIALLNTSGTQFNNSTGGSSNSRIANNTISNNAQGGVLLADVDLGNLNIPTAVLRPGFKGIALTNRGNLALDIVNNSVTNNATSTTAQTLADAIDDATNRTDRFGVQITSTTASQSTITFDSNTLTQNGVPSSVAATSTSGGLGILAGGSSQIAVNVSDSTFRDNAGASINAIVGSGPITTNAARLDLDIDRSLIVDPQLADTDDGDLATGIDIVADTGTLNTTIRRTVIQGDPTVLAGTYDRMEAVHSFAKGDSVVTTRLVDAGLNMLGRSGNELVGWHVGVGGNANQTGSLTTTINDTLIDAECVLKLHAGPPGGTTRSTNITSVRDSVFIARLDTTSPLDAALTDAIGGGVLSLSITDTQFRFEGVVDSTTPNRSFFDIRASESGSNSFSLNRTTPQNSMLGFADFISLYAEGDATLDATIRDSTLGVTRQEAIDAEAFEAARVTLTVRDSVLSGNAGNLVSGFAADDGVFSGTLLSNTFNSPTQPAVWVQARARSAGDDARVGLTMTSNQITAPGGALEFTTDAILGSATGRLNLSSNTANSSYLLQAVETAPGTSTLTLFDGSGNTPAPSSVGTISTSATLLDILFP